MTLCDILIMMDGLSPSEHARILTAALGGDEVAVRRVLAEKAREYAQGDAALVRERYGDQFRQAVERIYGDDH